MFLVCCIEDVLEVGDVAEKIVVKDSGDVLAMAFKNWHSSLDNRLLFRCQRHNIYSLVRRREDLMSSE
jgi:hypothetical protein